MPAEKRLSWLATILPYMDLNHVATRIDWNIAWEDKKNHVPVSTLISAYVCPAHPRFDPSPNQSHYVGLAGLSAEAPFLEKDQPNVGFFGYYRRISRSDIRDGLESTIVALETTDRNGPWAAGGQATIRSLDLNETRYLSEGGPFGMKHKTDTFFRTNPIVANAAFADGSVRSIAADIVPEVLRALVTIAGGEEVNPDF